MSLIVAGAAGAAGAAFSNTRIGKSVSQLMAVKLIFLSPWYNARFYNEAANITIFLLLSSFFFLSERTVLRWSDVVIRLE